MINTLKSRIYRMLVFLSDTFIYIMAAPLVIILVLMYKSRILLFRTCVMIIAIVPGEYGNILRWGFYKLTLKRVGRKFRIQWMSYIVYPDVIIGDNVTIEEKCVISKAKIGNDVIFAAGVSTMSGKNHHYVDDLSKSFYESGGESKVITIGNNQWIGTHAVIMADLAPGTVVAAGAIVTKTFPPNSIIGGVPARLIRARGIK